MSDAIDKIKRIWSEFGNLPVPMCENCAFWCGPEVSLGKRKCHAPVFSPRLAENGDVTTAWSDEVRMNLINAEKDASMILADYEGMDATLYTSAEFFCAAHKERSKA